MKQWYQFYCNEAGKLAQVARIFYILKTISGGWSRNALTNCIKADYYHTSGGAICCGWERKGRARRMILLRPAGKVGYEIRLEI